MIVVRLSQGDSSPLYVIQMLYSLLCYKVSTTVCYFIAFQRNVIRFAYNTFRTAQYTFLLRKIQSFNVHTAKYSVFFLAPYQHINALCVHNLEFLHVKTGNMYSSQ